MIRNLLNGFLRWIGDFREWTTHVEGKRSLQQEPSQQSSQQPQTLGKVRDGSRKEKGMAGDDVADIVSAGFPIQKTPDGKIEAAKKQSTAARDVGATPQPVSDDRNHLIQQGETRAKASSTEGATTLGTLL